MNNINCTPWVLILLFLSFGNISAQEALDAEINALYETSLSYKRHPDSLEKYARKILKIAKPTQNINGLLKGYYGAGHAAFQKGAYNESIALYDSALVHQKQGLVLDYKVTIKIMRNKAISFAVKGDLDSAKDQFESLITIHKEANDYVNLANTYNDLGIGEKNRSNYTEAIDLYKKAMHIWDSLDLEEKKTSVFLNIGIAQAGLGDQKQSNKSFHRALEISEAYNNDRDKYKAYNNLSVNLINQKKYDSALVYLRKLLPYYISRNIKREEYLAYQNIGKAFLNQSMMDSAAIYFTKSLSGYKEINIKEGRAESLYLMSELCLKRKEHQKALQYADSSATIAKEVKYTALLKNIYNQLALVYEDTKDYENANKYLKFAEEIEDKQFEIENTKALNELLTKEQSKQKDKRINSLKTQKSIYKSTAFLLTVVAIALLIIFALYWKRYRTSEKELQELRNTLETYNTVSGTSLKSLLHLKSKAVVKTEQLMYVKSDGHYLEFYSEGSAKPEIDRNTLKDVNETLLSYGFAQIHKSYLVNLQFIRIINSTKVMLENGTWLPLSRTYKPRLKEVLHANDLEK